MVSGVSTHRSPSRSPAGFPTTPERRPPRCVCERRRGTSTARHCRDALGSGQRAGSVGGRCVVLLPWVTGWVALRTRTLRVPPWVMADSCRVDADMGGAPRAGVDDLGRYLPPIVVMLIVVVVAAVALMMRPRASDEAAARAAEQEAAREAAELSPAQHRTRRVKTDGSAGGQADGPGRSDTEASASVESSDGSVSSTEAPAEQAHDAADAELPARTSGGSRGIGTTGLRRRRGKTPGEGPVAAAAAGADAADVAVATTKSAPRRAERHPALSALPPVAVSMDVTTDVAPWFELLKDTSTAPDVAELAVAEVAELIRLSQSGAFRHSNKIADITKGVLACDGLNTLEVWRESERRSTSVAANKLHESIVPLIWSS